MRPKKRPDTAERRRFLLERLDDVLAESVDTRRRVANRMELDSEKLEREQKLREAAVEEDEGSES